MARFETVFAVLLIPLAMFYIWQGTQVPEPPRNVVVGPRTFPLLIGGLMLAVCAALVWQRFRQAGAVAERDETTTVPLDDDAQDIEDWIAVAIVLGALLALFVSFEVLGFVVAIALFLFGLTTFFAPRRWLLNVVVSLGFSSLFFFLFTEVLSIPLPMGVLSFLTEE